MGFGKHSKHQTPDDGTSNKDNEPEDKTPEMMRVFVIIGRVLALITTPGEVKQEPRLLQEEKRTVIEFLEQLLGQVKRLESGPNSSPDSNSKKSDATDSSRFEDNEVQEQILGKDSISKKTDATESSRFEDNEVREQILEKDSISKKTDATESSRFEDNEVREQILEKDSNSKKSGATDSSRLSLPRNKPLTLRFYYPEENTVYHNLLEELKTKIRLNKCDVYWEKCNEPEAISNTPLLVLCINISRIGVDINNALRGIHRGNSIILLIVHMKEAHDLPRKETTLEIQHDHVKHVIEVAYTTERGLYNWEKNKRAKETLEMILNSMKRA